MLINQIICCHLLFGLHLGSSLALILPSQPLWPSPIGSNQSNSSSQNILGAWPAEPWSFNLGPDLTVEITEYGADADKAMFDYIWNGLREARQWAQEPGFLHDPTYDIFQNQVLEVLFFVDENVPDKLSSNDASRILQKIEELFRDHRYSPVELFAEIKRPMMPTYFLDLSWTEHEDDWPSLSWDLQNFPMYGLYYQVYLCGHASQPIRQEQVLLAIEQIVDTIMNEGNMQGSISEDTYVSGLIRLTWSSLNPQDILIPISRGQARHLCELIIDEFSRPNQRARDLGIRLLNQEDRRPLARAFLTFIDLGQQRTEIDALFNGTKPTDIFSLFVKDRPQT